MNSLKKSINKEFTLISVQEVHMGLTLKVYSCHSNGCRIYVDKRHRKKFSWLAWNSFIGQFIYPVGGEGIG